MLLKDKSITTSSKSNTSNRQQTPSHGTDVPIQFVKGVGPRLGAVFNNREIRTVQDLLFFFPRTYEDRSQFLSVKDLQDGTQTTLAAQVVSQRRIPIQKFGKSILEVRVSDGTGTLFLKWFHSPKGMEKKFTPGAQLVVTGKVKFYSGRPEIVHPEVTWGGVSQNDDSVEEGQPNVGRVIPVYTEIEGIPTRTLRKVLWEALSKFGKSLEEDLPQSLLQKYALPSLAEAVDSIHFPPEGPQYSLARLAEFQTPAHQRFIYGEFFQFQYLMLRKRLNLEKAQSPSFSLGKGRAFMEKLMGLLPFQLTNGQHKALEDITSDFQSSFPMNRLVQGDVGSGKTAVAFLSAAYVVGEGHQVALLAPTEILAEQHFYNSQKLFGKQLNAGLLTGKTTAAERNQLHSRMISGEPLLVIGTHALLEDNVEFSSLAYVMIDEQHRFGVEQRRTLKQKGAKKTNGSQGVVFPHSLIMTATPIPRTLSLTVFGDLSVTSIQELPPGRSPIGTRVVGTNPQRQKAYAHIKSQLAQGRQAYFIYPLVNESEAEGFTQLKSAVNEAELLAQEVFPEFSVGLLHGQMKADEKAEVMQKFKQGKHHILVSTTVVEVGVDVPNATVIAIEHAERFGLSQLHQLRGRVGRGQYQSHCYLFSSTQSPESWVRLQVLENTNDGFKIAEADLEIRGPGEFLGTRQAGSLPFKLANLVRDREWLLRARDDAMTVLSQDPNLLREENSCLKRYLLREGEKQLERLKTS